VQPGLIDTGRGESVQDYAWSGAARRYAVAAWQRAAWLAVAALGSLGLPHNAVGRCRRVESLDRSVIEEGLERAGIPLGDP
jgi:hypothetical protein